MVKTVVSVDLPVDEKLTIKKNSIQGGTSKKRFALITEIHGDELEGQGVCWELQRRLHLEMQNLNGTVDIYPSLNPLGTDCITRSVPAFDLDMNRTFPGDPDGTMTEYIAAKILEDIQGADFALDIHSSSIFVREIPQVRIPPRFKDQVIEYAKVLNMDFIWFQDNTSVQENSLVYTLNERGTPCAVIDIGIGMSCTQESTQQITDGIFCLLKKLGMWGGKTIEPKNSICCDNPQNIIKITSPHAGFFIRKVSCGDKVQKGQPLGIIIDPLEGRILDTISAPESGTVFTLREYPILETGSKLGRIFK